MGNNKNELSDSAAFETAFLNGEKTNDIIFQLIYDLQALEPKRQNLAKERHDVVQRLLSEAVRDAGGGRGRLLPVPCAERYRPAEHRNREPER
jgi:hypothetical protein